MGREPTLAKGNVFYEARIAAKKLLNSNSREAACELTNIDRNRMVKIETDRTNPHQDELLIMAEEYDAPYLIEHYCNHICEIGRKYGCKYVDNKGDAYKSTVMFVHSLKEAEVAKEQILEILADGKITSDEIEILDKSIEQLSETMTDIINLKIALEKEKIKR